MDDDPISEGHYLAFGLIVQQFAKFERVIEFIINGAMRGQELGLTALVISGLSYSKKCDTLAALLEIIILPAGGNDVVARFVKKFNEHKKLRNFVAHSSWTRGIREDSIRPLSISTNWGKFNVLGLEDIEKDCTPTELLEIAAILERIRLDLQSFLRASASVAENIDTGNPSPNKPPSPTKNP
jgi:hypothetical protein